MKPDPQITAQLSQDWKDREVLLKCASIFRKDVDELEALVKAGAFKFFPAGVTDGVEMKVRSLNSYIKKIYDKIALIATRTNETHE